MLDDYDKREIYYNFILNLVEKMFEYCEIIVENIYLFERCCIVLEIFRLFF